MATSSDIATEGSSKRAPTLEEGAGQPARSDEARNAGRGGIAVLGAKVFFILSGLAQQTLLPRAIGLAGYGALARVLALANVLNNVVVASSTQGVSRAVARAVGSERRAFFSTLRVHVPLAVVLAAGFAASAPALAAFEGAPHIERPLLLMSLVALFYGLYAPLIGWFNGRRLFTRQAALDITFAVLRTAGLVGVGLLFARRGGSGVVGSTLGFVLAAAMIVPTAALLARSRDERNTSKQSLAEDLRAKTYLTELGPLAAAQFFTNAVMQVDITLLGHFLSQGGTTEQADEWVAVYRACQLFAFLPYQLLLSIAQVLFPMVARAKAENDLAGVERYVERGARIAALACGLMVGVIVGLPEQLLAFAYSPEVAARGASTLRVLAIGQGAYAILAIATTVLASLGRERLAATITLGALVTVLASCTGLVAGRPFGAPMLQATAIGTSLALFAALAAAGSAVRRIAGRFVPWRTAARVGLSLACAAGVGSLLPTSRGRLLTPVLAALVGIAYLVPLVVTRELTKDDTRALRRAA